MGIDPHGAVRQRKRQSVVDAAVELRVEVALREIDAGDRPPGDAFLMIDAPERLAGVGVSRTRFEREDVLWARDILRGGQLFQAEEDRSGGEKIELARRIVDLRVI